MFYRGLDKDQNVLLTHGDSIDQVAKDFNVIARSGDITAGMVADNYKTLYLIIVLIIACILNLLFDDD